jgi:hypothetical protein
LLRELATIAERQCRNPRINLSIFPGTPAAGYWSATARPVQGAVATAFALDFGAEGLRNEDRDQAHHVRLVRNSR